MKRVCCVCGKPCGDCITWGEWAGQSYHQHGNCYELLTMACLTIGQETQHGCDDGRLMAPTVENAAKAVVYARKAWLAQHSPPALCSVRGCTGHGTIEREHRLMCTQHAVGFDLFCEKQKGLKPVDCIVPSKVQLPVLLTGDLHGPRLGR